MKAMIYHNVQGYRWHRRRASAQPLALSTCHHVLEFGEYSTGIRWPHDVLKKVWHLRIPCLGVNPVRAAQLQTLRRCIPTSVHLTITPLFYPRQFFLTVQLTARLLLFRVCLFWQCVRNASNLPAPWIILHLKVSPASRVAVACCSYHHLPVFLSSSVRRCAINRTPPFESV